MSYCATLLFAAIIASLSLVASQPFVLRYCHHNQPFPPYPPKQTNLTPPTQRVPSFHDRFITRLPVPHHPHQPHPSTHSLNPTSNTDILQYRQSTTTSSNTAIPPKKRLRHCLVVQPAHSTHSLTPADSFRPSRKSARRFWRSSGLEDAEIPRYFSNAQVP